MTPVQEQLERARKKAKAIQAETLTLVKDPSFQTCTLSTAGGTVVLGAAGGAFGLACGVVVGAGAGLVPAIFTLGLSIPVGATVGGGAGLCLGGAAGGTVGGAAGFGAYRYRVEIRDGLLFVKRKACDTTECAKKGAIVVTSRADGVITLARARGKAALAVARATPGRAYELATTTRSGATAAGALAGGAVGGTAGATVGTVAGAALGVVPAVFTLGLSIPIGAALGCCAGAVTGGGAGAAGGGAVGFGAFAYREELREGVGKAWGDVKSQACTRTIAVTDRARALLGRGGGGSRHESRAA